MTTQIQEFLTRFAGFVCLETRETYLLKLPLAGGEILPLRM